MLCHGGGSFLKDSTAALYLTEKQRETLFLLGAGAGGGDLLPLIAFSRRRAALFFERERFGTALPFEKAALLPPLLEDGFWAVGLRPLRRLNPCFLLWGGKKRPGGEEKCQVDRADSYTLSRRMEEGFALVSASSDCYQLQRSGRTAP